MALKKIHCKHILSKKKTEKSVNREWQQLEIATSSIIAEFDSRINNVASVLTSHKM